VVEHGDKYVLFDLGGKHELVSVDLLKSARGDPTMPVPLAHLPRQGCPPLADHANAPQL